MILHLPTSTLFPYTTLFRSDRPEGRSSPRSWLPPSRERRHICSLRRRRAPGPARRRSARSEEHTSELQSRLHLVCRLLLEKKNTFSLSRKDLPNPECVDSRT